jgi:methylglutaconyl-CoA hydratase
MKMSGTEATLYEIIKGAAWITLNRPENRNALSSILVSELYEHLKAANDDPAVRSIVITGTGPAFCAGADLKSPPGQTIEGSGRAVPYAEVLTTILESDKPVVAAVNGAAFAGGLGLVGAADIVITVDDVKFSFSEVRIGVIPAVISVVCLPKLGTHHGMKLFLTGERFTGTQAVEMGFAHRAVPQDQLIEAVEEEIDMINLGGPNAVVECKKLVRRVQELSIEQGFKETSEWSARLFKSEEGTEGITAFREKRKPSWAQDN